MRWAFSLALARAGRSIAARMAMIAMTTSSSMRVKAACLRKAALPAMTRLICMANFKSDFSRLQLQPVEGGSAWQRLSIRQPILVLSDGQIRPANRRSAQDGVQRIERFRNSEHQVRTGR